MFNIITQTDSYKVGHANQYLPNTQKVYSYFESRVGAEYNATIFFGLQYLLKEYLTGEVVTWAKLKYALPLLKVHLKLSDEALAEIRERWEYIIKVHHGKLPLEIMAVPEGTKVPTGNVLMTVKNTDDKCFWLTNYVESILTHLWYSCNVATISACTKDILLEYAKATTEGPDYSFVDFQLHDFGYRSASSVESAGIGGAAHLLSFKGTDTIPAIETMIAYYSAPMCGFSVPATEHSVMTAGGREDEEKVFCNLLEKYPTGILSVVIDSYDYKKFIAMAAKYKARILARDGKLVFRPDSGDPVEVTQWVLDALCKTFGYETNSLGFNELNPAVGVLWGDGIDTMGIEDLLEDIRDSGYASSNIVFGMGGHLLQNHNRDTQRFAFKCSAQQRDNLWRAVYKEPLDTSKASKKGMLSLRKAGDIYYTEQRLTFEDIPTEEDHLKPVFYNGKLIREYTYEDIILNIQENCHE